MSSWGEILVEWCNCLQLNPEIKDVNELRESDFFKNILSILNKTDLSSKLNQPFIQILTLLSETYQHAQIEDINCDSFTELQEDKFLIITSLLLHYTCIYDGREQFTLPLCQNLTKKSQLSIKDFLEKVNKEVTYSDLEKLIVQERIYEYVESKPTRPLTAVFRTPSLKRKFNFEKDRTVNKLKTALELEQYEKADVEEELKLQIKKTQKLERMLSKSNDEISALKSEIFKMKCQTPPQCSKRHDSEHKMRLMRKELENFEQYIENSEKENEILREEHHLYKQKIKDYEVEYAKLRSKYLAYEEQIDELTKMLNEKSLREKQLETHCKELNEILEGFRQQKPESTESSFCEYVQQNKMNTSYINQENLASAVIEIQLKEAQEQIDQLNIRIASGEEENKQSIQKIGNLQQELNFAYKKQSELENQLIHEKEKSVQEIELIKNELNISEKENKEILNRIIALQELIDNLNLEKTHQLIEIEKRDTKILEMENIISTVKKETEKWTLDFEFKNQELEKVMTKYKILQEKLEEYARFEQIMKQHVKDIKIFHGKEYKEITDLVSKLKESILLCKKELSISEESRDKLNIELKEKIALNSTLLNDLENLKEELNKTTSDWKEDKKQKEHLIDKLSESEKNLVGENEKYTKEIEKINIEKEEVCNNLRLSEKKNNEILNRIIVVQESLDHLNSEKNDHLTEIKEQAKKILELENIISSLSTETEKWRSSFTSKNKELEEMLTKYEQSQHKLEEYLIFKQKMKQYVIELKAFHNKDFNEFNVLVSKLKEHIHHYENELAKTEQSKEKLQTDLNETKASNSALVNDLENLKEELNRTTTSWTEDKKEKENTIKKLSESEKKLIMEKESYIKKNEQIKIERNDLLKNVELSEKKTNDVLNTLTVLQEKFDNLNLEKNNLLTKIEEHEARISKSENKIVETEANSEALLNSKNKELQEIIIKHEKSKNELEQYISFHQIMKKQVDEFKTFHKQNSSEYQELISKLKESIRSYHEKLEQSEELNKKLQKEVEEKKASYFSLLTDLDKLREEINKITLNWNEEKMQKENLLGKLSQLENQLVSEKQKYLEDIEEIKNERNNLFDKSKHYEKENKEILNRILVLQETIDQLNAESNNKLERMEKDDVKISELENIISNLKAELDLSNSSLSSKNSELQKLMVNYQNSSKKIEKYAGFEKFMKQHVNDLKSFHKKESCEFNKLISNLKESVDIYENKLSISEEQNKHLATELKEMKTSNSTLLNDLINLKEVMDKTNSDWGEDKRKVEKIMNENQLLKDNFIGLTQTIKLFNDELNKIVRSLKERKNKSNIILNKLQSAYKEVNTSDLLKTPEKNSKPNDVSSEIKILGEQISKLNVYIDIFSEKETFYLKELESLKEELSVSNNDRFEVIETLKEQILENEHQISSQTETLHSLVEKYNQLQLENQEYLNKIEKYESESKDGKKEISLKESIISDLKEKIEGLEEEIINLKKLQSNKTEELLEKLVISQDQNAKDNEEIEKYKTKIVSLEARIAIFKEEIAQIKSKTSLTEEEYQTNLANLQVQVVKNKLEITELRRKYDEVNNEKQDLTVKLRVMENERDQEIKDRKTVEDELAETAKVNSDLQNTNITLMKDLETFKELQDKCYKYEQDRSNVKFLEEKHVELSQKIETLMKSSEMQKESYEVFKIYYRKFRDELDKLLSQKNSLENLTNNLRTQMVSLNKYMSCDNSKRMLEKKEALDVISEDIIKQYNRYSKQINDIVQELVRYYEKNCDNIFASLEIKIEDCLEKYNIPELGDLLSDLTDRAVDILDQVRVFQREFENSSKEEDQQKENILTTSRKINIDKMKEDDLKKKNITLRQKLTLLENTKGNLEKTVKKLREENKKLRENDNGEVPIENDAHYKILLQEYISYKEDQERILKEYKMRLEDLQKEYEEHKDNCMRTSTPIGEVFFSQQEADKNLESELDKLKLAFSNVRISNEKLENENMFLKQIASAHKEEMGKFSSIKEAYDKLLEENNKLMTEVDTMKYKRTRDRDEFLRCLKKERHDNESKNIKMIQNIKAEYETKLEKMKDKMIKLYREEVNKEMSKIKGKQQESNSLVKTVEQLKCDLFEANQKIQLLMERDTQKRNQDNNMLSQMHGSSSQLHELDTLSLKDFPLSCMNSTAIDSKPKTSIAKFMEFKHPHKVNPSSLDTRRQYEDRQVRTLPRTGTIVEEVNIRRRTSFGVPNSIGNLQMEDEEEMFNNKYLTDLKQGNCELPAAEGRDSRVSELAWRNSLVPPHLKSSYPAETQFCSPERFREDDIKCGGGNFDDSSCKLLPNEKRKKDFGTTSYKKPGPPTPSKNGGRLSLTGSDIHVTKEQPSESKKNTPGRIRSLFTGRSSSRNSIEPGTSPKKRLSIFRK